MARTLRLETTSVFVPRVQPRRDYGLSHYSLFRNITMNTYKPERVSGSGHCRHSDVSHRLRQSSKPTRVNTMRSANIVAPSLFLLSIKNHAIDESSPPGMSRRFWSPNSVHPAGTCVNTTLEQCFVGSAARDGYMPKSALAIAKPLPLPYSFRASHVFFGHRMFRLGIAGCDGKRN